MIDLQDYGKNYRDQYAHGEFETVIARVRRDKVVQSVERYAHRTVLEVGCGFEPLFPHVHGYDEYWVVEPLPEAVAAARAHPSASERLHVIEGFLEAAPEGLPSIVDFIAVSSLLHEVPDPVALLRAVQRHCGTDTIVHVNVPNVRSFHRLLALEAGLISDTFEKSATEVRFQRQTRFDKETLWSFLEENGFEILEGETYFVKPFTHGQMEQMLKAGIIDLRIVEALDRMTKYMPELGSEMYANARLRR